MRRFVTGSTPRTGRTPRAGSPRRPRDAGIQAVKDKRHAACTDRKGTPKPDAFELVFERTSDHPDLPKPHYVDAKMQCDLPES